MIPIQIQFRVYERNNSFQKSGKEWALSAKLGNHGAWVLKTWDKKPSDSVIVDTKEMIVRSFEFYHRHLQIPSFSLVEV